MKKLLYFNFLLTLTIWAGLAKASHVPGGNITYECVGPNQYLVTLTLFEDCGTAFTGNTNQNITISNDCGLVNPNGSLPNTVFQQEISQLCPSSVNQSECNGGTLPGIYMHQWQAVITLPADCDSWTFGYSSCCRNTTTNVNGQPGYYWESVLNSTTAPCNTSPQITNPAVPYVCVGQAVCYNLGVYEPDGHTLVYSLISGQSAAGTNITYNGGFTPATPIPGITIDPNTGQLDFTPGTAGNYVVVILIEEFDANGNLVGSVIHDIQFEVVNCANQILDCNSSGQIANITGAVFQTGPNQLQMCEGTAFCFDISYDDLDATDSLTYTSNIATVLPGATVNASYPNAAANDYSEIDITICWTPPPGSSNLNTAFSITLDDNACPVSGQQTFVYDIDVVGATFAMSDTVICGSQVAELEAVNGTTFTWVALSGDPIVVGTNFSCNPCSNPQATPSVTTVYEVTSDLSGNCVSKDTVTVTVVPNFTYAVTQSNVTACLQEPVQVDVTPSPAGAYTYNWTPPGGLNATNIPNPQVTQGVPGSYTYYLELISPDGCTYLDSVDINVIGAYTPDITLLADVDTIANCGDPVNLDIDLGGGIPATCATNPVPCASPNTSIVGVANGANTTTSFPAPYGNWYRNAKHQFLFTAAELNAMGFTGGKISEIAWEITQINGTTNYNAFEIQMGCTQTTNLTTWEQGLNVVMPATNITITPGWNVHALTNSYDWDGVSNLVVQICYDNLATAYTNNSITPWTTTAFTSTLYYRSDATAACPYTGTPTTSTNRPVTRFGWCPSTPDPSNYSYTWTANPGSQTAGIVSPNTQQTAAVPVVPTWYVATVTDIAGGCSDTDSILVHVDCCDPSNIIVTDLTCNQAADGAISVEPIGIHQPFVIDVINVGNSSNVFNQGGVNQNQVVDITGLDAGTYKIEVVDTTLCTWDTTIIITEPTPIDVIVQDTTICIDGIATLNATVSGGNGGPYTLDWNGVGTGVQQVQPVLTTAYDLVVTDPNGCTNQTPVQMNVTVHDSIQITLNVSEFAVCPGFTVDMDVTASGGDSGPYTYIWSDGTNTIGNTDQITIAPTDPLANYCISVVDGCETPQVVECVDISVHPIPQPLFSSDIIEDCSPAVVTFSNDTDPTLVGTVSWDFENTATSTGNNPTVTFTDLGSYDVYLMVTTPEGCIVDTTYEDYITVHGYPTADFIFGPQPTNFFAPTITFLDTSSIDVVTWDWEFGTGGMLGTSDQENPVFDFPNNEPGNYDVELVVTNQFGCADSITYTVIIDGIFVCYVPNAFTPNGDGLNDFFGPTGEGVDPEGYEMWVYDRWGQVMFNTTSFTEKWDGSIPGGSVGEMKSDVYTYKILAKDLFTGEEHEIVGHVTLLR